MVLGPLLHGIGDDEWQKAPRGKWSPAQIVAHLAMGIDRSSSVFAQRANKQGMLRRSNPGQAILRHLLLGFGTFPPGRRAPEATRPPERPDPELVSAQFRMGVDRFATLLDTWPKDRQVGVFVQHPLLGDLNLPEWIRFHYVHCRHHARQIRDRLKWMRKGQKGKGRREK